MSADQPLAAERLTERITAIEGVRGIFPHSVAAVVLSAARPGRGSGLVQVDRGRGTTTVTARLSTSRRTPAAQIASRVADVVAEAAGSERVVLRIEFAHID